jgi:hypothetical protein
LRQCMGCNPGYRRRGLTGSAWPLSCSPSVPSCISSWTPVTLYLAGSPSLAVKIKFMFIFMHYY